MPITIKKPKLCGYSCSVCGDAVYVYEQDNRYRQQNSDYRCILGVHTVFSQLCDMRGDGCRSLPKRGQHECARQVHHIHSKYHNMPDEPEICTYADTCGFWTRGHCNKAYRFAGAGSIRESAVCSLVQLTGRCDDRSDDMRFQFA